MPIKEIVEHVGRMKSTVTGTVNTVERHGYVRKTPSEQDARVMNVELTKKGQALKPGFDEISVILLEKLYGKTPRCDRETLAEGLAQIRQTWKMSSDAPAVFKSHDFVQELHLIDRRIATMDRSLFFKTAVMATLLPGLDITQDASAQSAETEATQLLKQRSAEFEREVIRVTDGV